MLSFWIMDEFGRDLFAKMYQSNCTFWQGHNQVYNRRWARLENSPFPNPPPEISILVHHKQISVVSRSDKQIKKKKKKGPLLICTPLPFHFKFPPPLLQFLLFLSIFLVFPHLSFPFPPHFPSPFPFPPLPLLSKISPKLSRVGNSSTLPTLSYASAIWDVFVCLCFPSLLFCVKVNFHFVTSLNISICLHFWT